MGGATASRRVTSEDRCVLDMKVQRDKLRQYQRRIQVVLDREREVARVALRNGNERKARLALRARKYQEQLLVKTDAQLETLEQLVSSIEFARIEKDVLFGLRQGNQVLKDIHREMSLDNVQKLMDETADAQAYQREVEEMLQGSMTREEDDEVEAELAEMQREQLAGQLPEVPEAVPDVPKIPEITDHLNLPEVPASRRTEREEPAMLAS